MNISTGDVAHDDDDITLSTECRRHLYSLSRSLLEIAFSSESGVATRGRSAELQALSDVGYRDPSLGRIFEGHINAGQLIARYGSVAQRRKAEHDISNGHIFAVWNTQDANGVRLKGDGDMVRLSGAKTWASGAGSLSRAIVTASWPDGSLQMCLVPMDRVSVQIDRSRWAPLGMEHSHSFGVDFSGVSISRDELIGQPNDYERQPWFFGGALRFLAVQSGIVERIVTEALQYLDGINRAADPAQQMRAAQMRIAIYTCRNWVRSGADAWRAFDQDESEQNAAAIINVVDMGRIVIERAALDVIELSVKSVGARGLVEPFPLATLVRDLQMYLRQPAPDAALMRIGREAFREATSARNITIASSTATKG